MKPLKLDVFKHFKSLFDIDSKYLVIQGTPCTGKFYAACQKIIKELLSNKSNAVVLTAYHDEYEINVIAEILGRYCVYQNSLKKFTFSNGSAIYLVNDFNKLPISVDYVVIKNAEFFRGSSFRLLNRRSYKQCIITVNDIPESHWLENINYRLYKLNQGISSNVVSVSISK